jgi:CNT family concentrative nucleoside transporter
MLAPAALVFSKLLVSETEEPQTLGHVKVKYEKTDANVIETIANGTTVWLRLAVNVGAMLINFMTLLYLANYLLNFLGNLLPFSFTKNIAFDKLFSIFFAPLSWLLGVDTKDIFVTEQLIGQKTFFSKFVAYAKLYTNVFL